MAAGAVPRLVPLAGVGFVALIGLAAGALAWWQGPWLSHTADAFYHLAAVRSALTKGEAFPTLPLYADRGGWPDPTSGALHSLLAYVCLLLGADPVAVWRVWHLVAAALPSMALARFAWLASGRALVGLLAVLLQLFAFGGFDLRTAAYPNQVGMALFWAVLGLALAGRPLLTSVGIVGLALLHVGLATAALVVLLGVCVVQPRLLAAVAAGAIAVALRSLPLADAPTVIDARVGTPAFPSVAPPSAGALAPTAAALVGEHSLPPSPAVAAAVVALVVVTLVLARRRPLGPHRVVLLFAGMSLAPLAALVVSAVGLPSSLAYAAARVAVVLAAAQPVLLAWALVEVAVAWRTGGGATRVIRAGAALLLVSSIVEGVARLGPTPAVSHSFASSRAGDLSVLWRDRVAALPPGAVLVGDPEVVYQLAGLADVTTAATPLSHTPAAVARTDGWLRRGDALDLLDLTAEPLRIASIAERLGPSALLIVDATAPAWATWRDRPPPIFAQVAGGADWVLLRYQRGGLAAYLDVPQGEVRPQELLAGEAAFVRQRAPVELRDGSGRTVARSETAGELQVLRVPGNATIGWYQLAGTTIGLGHEYEAESFPIRELPADGRQPPGWALYSQSFYGRHRAARTTDLAAVGRPIPPLPPARYSVRVRVYEYEYAVPNELQVRLGSNVVAVDWAAGTRAPRIVSNELVTVTLAESIEMRLTRREQPLAIVDWIRVYPAR